jgi:hypothetical protein
LTRSEIPALKWTDYDGETIHAVRKKWKEYIGPPKTGIQQFVNSACFGWHAFRRGPGTRLSKMGMDDSDIQCIRRQGDISTVQAFYISPSPKRAEAGLKELGETVRKKHGIKV